MAIRSDLVAGRVAQRVRHRARVVAARAGQIDRLAGLRRIGIDEISYRYVGDPCQGVSQGFFDELLPGR
jgi:hypothetical protein